MNSNRYLLLFLSLFFGIGISLSQDLNSDLVPLLANVYNRDKIDLNGKWHYIMDPYETGYYDYRMKPNPSGFFKDVNAFATDRLIEYDFGRSQTLNVPGDWNTQYDKLLYYEGTIWYERKFNYHKSGSEKKRVFIYFGAVNYNAKVWINGKYVGEHTGGFTPFNFEITPLLKDENSVVLKVDNTRSLDGVPTSNMDWWNFGGLTRSVYLIELPDSFIEDYFIQLSDLNKKQISGWVKVNHPTEGEKVKLEIPELKENITIVLDAEGRGNFSFSNKTIQLWSPENPKRYRVRMTYGEDSMEDNVGLRYIETKGEDIYLNGKPVFLRGICIHEEAPYGGSRVASADQAQILLNWTKDLNCNFVRLVHYPHNEEMVRLAEKMGIMVWSEIPVYWTINWENQQTLQNALLQLEEEITRDRNRANIIIWSVANETPIGKARSNFLRALVKRARQLDDSRLLSAALQAHLTEDPNVTLLDDPLGEDLDVLGCNVYPGWYGPSATDKTKFTSIYKKPLVMSEIGGAAVQGLHGPKETRWTEEFQEQLYKDDITMLKNIPFLRGVTPWVLKDFRSPKRVLPTIQDGWNLKGLVSDSGTKKKAFKVLKAFYDEKSRE